MANVTSGVLWHPMLVSTDKPLKLKTDNLIGFTVIHILAALALLPWFFSWTGVALFVFSIYFYGMLGINVGFHRLLTHRAFSCPLWFEHTVAIVGAACAQFSPAYWVAIHRRHHHYTDVEQDPHSPNSPIKSFFWAHFGWLLFRSPDMKPAPMIDRYARDLMRDPLYVWLERRKHWMLVTLLSWLLVFVIGFCVGMIRGDTYAKAYQFGSSLFVWGGPLRTVFVWHAAWSVNSITHLWGYRGYNTPDDSRNNVWVAIMASGEGWHNNHHADPSSARHGHKWWEIDLTWMIIQLFMAMGVITNVKLPSPNLAATFPPVVKPANPS